MAQHLPAGKLVKARHLQQLWIYAADAVTEVDHHSWNCGCGHDEDARLSVKSEPHQCQNHPAYGRNGLEHMDQWGSHILYLGTQAKQQPQNSANALKEFKHPRLAGYDLNSRFELEPGKKDPVRILTFLNELK